MRRAIWVGLVAIGLAGCGRAHSTAQPHGVAAVIHLLEREGYKPPEAPDAPPTAQSSSRLGPPPGTPVASLSKGGLGVIVDRATSGTSEGPEALWLRSGSAIVLGYPRSPTGLTQWLELTKALCSLSRGAVTGRHHPCK
jgi:hypothetical protein